MNIQKFINSLRPTKDGVKPFAILIDDSSKGRRYINGLRSNINRNKKLKEEDFYYRDKSLRQLSYGDVIVFGLSKDVDFVVENNFDVVKKLKVDTVFSLKHEYYTALASVNEYTKTKYPPKKRKRPQPKELEIEIEVEVVRPKKKKKKKTTYELCDVVTIHDNFVKKGYELYPRYLDDCGNDFIVVNGKQRNVVKKSNVSFLV